MPIDVHFNPSLNCFNQIYTTCIPIILDDRCPILEI